MTKIIVGVKLNIEGTHNFPKASEVFDERVKFLEYEHRHLFNIEIEKIVTHTERDKEFILFKREVENFIKNKYGSPAKFGPMSCESIALDLLESFDANQVLVGEDNENYSKVVR